MGMQEYRADYRAAFEAANNHLEDIYQEYHDLQHRKERLEEVVGALEPFLESAPSFTQPFHRVDPMRIERPAVSPALQLVTEHSVHNEAPIEPVSYELRPEPAAPPAFAPVQEETTDPLQLRINRALGLAVA